MLGLRKVDVVPMNPGPLVTLAQVKAALGIPGADTTRDVELQLRADMIAEQLENYCGRILAQRQVTETIFGVGGDASFVLTHYPAFTFTSLTDDAGNVFDPAAYVNDVRSGCIWSLPNASPFTPSVTAVYMAGFSPVPPTIVSAALLYAQTIEAEGSRDPNIASETIADVGTTTYVQSAATGRQIGDGETGAMIPGNVAEIMNHYIRRFA